MVILLRNADRKTVISVSDTNFDKWYVKLSGAPIEAHEQYITSFRKTSVLEAEMDVINGIYGL